MFSHYDIFIAAVGFLSGLIKTGVGVGAGIVLLPTLALAFPAKVALGLGAPMLLASDIMGLHYYWKQWLPRPQLMRLFLAIIPGLVLGVVLLPLIPGKAFRLCVGIFGTMYALSLLWPQFPVAVLLKTFFGKLNERCMASRDQNHKGAYIYGFLGGFSTVLAHAGGLVWSLYLITAAPDRRIFVGTTIILFFITNIYKSHLLRLHRHHQHPGPHAGDLPPSPRFSFDRQLPATTSTSVCHQVLFRKIVLCRSALFPFSAPAGSSPARSVNFFHIP